MFIAHDLVSDGRPGTDKTPKGDEIFLSVQMEATLFEMAWRGLEEDAPAGIRTQVSGSAGL